MNVVSKAVGVVTELKSVFFVAIGVTLASTIAGSVVDHQHQVIAEERVLHEIVAVPGAGSQTLTIPDWGVQVTVPLAPEMSLLRYAGDSQESRGLSSAELVKYGQACAADRNALGTLMRYPVGTYATGVKPGWGSNMVATVGDYDYVYQFPQNSCSDNDAARAIVNREESVLLEAFSSLTPVTP